MRQLTLKDSTKRTNLRNEVGYLKSKKNKRQQTRRLLTLQLAKDFSQVQRELITESISVF